MSRSKNIDLLEVATVLAVRKRTVFLIVFLTTLIGLLLAFIWPKTYRSEVSFVITDGNSVNLSAGGLLSGLANFQVGGGSITAEQTLVLLRSTDIKDQVINKFNLAEVYGTDIPEALRKKFDANVEIEDLREGGIGFNSIIALKLAYIGEDPGQVYDLVKYYYDVVDSTVKVLNKKNVEEGYMLISNRLDRNLKDMEAAEDSLVSFQSKYGILEVEEQAKAQIGAIAEVRTEIVKLEIQINYLENVLGADSGRLTDMKAQKQALERRYDNLMNGGGDNEGDTFDIFQPVDQMPTLFVEYLRRFREVMVQEEIYKVLYPQYEQQKLSYEEATSGLLIIDSPVKPTYKHGPKRAYIIIAAFMFSLILAFIVVFYKEWRDDLKENDPDEYERFRKLTAALQLRNDQS